MADWTVTLNDTIIKTFSIREGQTITIGRGKECDISIDNTAISRQHISLSLNSGIYFVSDLGSTNGSFVNGKKIETDEPVSEKDAIVFGKFTLTPVREGHSASRVASSIPVDTLDLDESTVFVSNKKPPLATQQFKPKATGPKITVVRGEASTKTLALGGTSSIKIGKDPSCDLVIPGWLVARAQAYIIKRDSSFILVPQRSWSGTYVNDAKITSEHTLRPGDVISIRGTTIRFD